jgi:hypothetical protein
MTVKLPPVGWLSVTELWNSAKRASISKTIGDYVDRREVFAALTSSVPPPAGLSEADGATWIDYVADVGDGYRATRAVALALNQRLESADGPTERGSILVFGGDQVYPTPSIERYEQRFLSPYDGLLDRRSIYSLPGNHDWYDGLTAYYKLFVAGSQLSIPGVTQKRSYFSFQVDNHPWWVWGIDFGLSGALDVPQTTYFEGIRDTLKDAAPGVGLVICTAEPFWEKDDPHMWKAICGLLPANVGAALFLSGDKHYFAAWAAMTGDSVTPAPGAQGPLTGIPVAFVTAGGGGAYLSLPDDLPESEYVAATPYKLRYPDSGYKKSLFGLMLSPKGGIWPLTAVVYSLMITIVRLAADQPASFDMLSRASDPSQIRRPAGLNEVIAYLADRGGIWTTFRRTWTEAKGATAWWVGVLLVIAALVALAKKGLPRDFKGNWKGKSAVAVAGGLHAVAHVLGILVVAVASLEVGTLGDNAKHAGIALLVLAFLVLVLFRPRPLPIAAILLGVGAGWVMIALDDHAGDADRMGRGIAYVGCMVIGGAIVGHAILMAYLALASRCRLNLNEASIALGSEDFKNFVRLRVSDRELTLYAYGIDDSKRVTDKDPDNEKGTLKKPFDLADCEVRFRARIGFP